MKAFLIVSTLIYIMDAAFMMARSQGWASAPASSSSKAFSGFLNLGLGVWGLVLLANWSAT